MPVVPTGLGRLATADLRLKCIIASVKVLRRSGLVPSVLLLLMTILPGVFSQMKVVFIHLCTLPPPSPY
jgi:hypothetical protein